MPYKCIALTKAQKTHMPALQSARILDQLRERIRYLHYSLRTEEAYVYWAKAFIRFHKLRHPADMGKPEIEAYLMWLDINGASVIYFFHFFGVTERR